MGDQVDTYAKILLVSGSGRSGTNITKEIFGRHSDVATLPFEYRFTIDPRGVVDFYNSYPNGWSPFWPDQKIGDFIAFLKSLAIQDKDKAKRVKEALALDPKGLQIAPPSYPGWDLEQAIPGFLNLVEELEEKLVSFRYGAVWPGSIEGSKNNQMRFAPSMSKEELSKPLQWFLDEVSKSILRKQEKRVFLEDNTYSILFAKELLELYPNGKLLHVIRDPRDVIASVVKQRWTPTELDHAIAWYQQIMNRWSEQKSSIDPNRFLEVRFEDLMNDSLQTVHQIADFFELEVEPKMLDIDLSKHHIGRYLNEFDQSQVSELENQLSEYIKGFGY